MDKDNKKELKSFNPERVYGNICQCKSCRHRFRFTEALARKISFGLEDKVCPKCGSSDITFIAFADSGVRRFVEKFKLPI